MSTTRMRSGRAFTVRSVLALALLGAAGCTQSSAAPTAGEEPATLQAGEAGAPDRITLSEHAETRLGVRTTPVTGTAGALVVPYSAVVYGADGSAFAFARTEPHVYARTPLTVASISGDTAALSAGPSTGTQLVTVGAPELVGIEAGISGEQ